MFAEILGPPHSLRELKVLSGTILVCRDGDRKDNKMNWNYILGSKGSKFSSGEIIKFAARASYCNSVCFERYLRPLYGVGMKFVAT